MNEDFEQIMQDYVLLQKRFEESVREACGDNEAQAVEIIDRHRGVIDGTIMIDRARAQNPALDAYATDWVTKNGGDPIPAGSGGRFVN